MLSLSLSLSNHLSVSFAPASVYATAELKPLWDLVERPKNWIFIRLKRGWQLPTKLRIRLVYSKARVSSIWKINATTYVLNIYNGIVEGGRGGASTFDFLFIFYTYLPIF